MLAALLFFMRPLRPQQQAMPFSLPEAITTEAVCRVQPAPKSEQHLVSYASAVGDTRDAAACGTSRARTAKFSLYGRRDEPRARLWQIHSQAKTPLNERR
jgi:hypothetical protein